MSETIIKECCPKCNKLAYYNLGNLDDQTVDDYDGFECPHCGHIWFSDDIDDDLTIEDAYICEGRKEL